MQICRLRRWQIPQLSSGRSIGKSPILRVNLMILAPLDNFLNDRGKKLNFFIVLQLICYEGVKV